jgi:hypothetical protein
VLLATNYTVIPQRPMQGLELPLAVDLEPDVRAVLEERGDRMDLHVERRIDVDHLRLEEDPSRRSAFPEVYEEPVRALRLDPYPNPEPVLIADLMSAIAFLTDVPLALSRRIEEDRFVPENDDDRELLRRLGTDEPILRTSLVASSRTFAGPVTSDRIMALKPRRIGVRIYADALKSSSVPAQFRELWRVLESAFGQSDGDLVDSLASFTPAARLGFDNEELADLLALRGRASHATSRPEVSLHEVVQVQRECENALPRLKNLAERVILTKRSWGYRTLAVDELEPLQAYVGRDNSTYVSAPATNTSRLDRQMRRAPATPT